MIVWLWDADGSGRRGLGVSDDQGRARQAAEACLRSGQADAARVEAAVVVDGTCTLTAGYQRTGQGRQAQRGPRGGIRWEPLVQDGTALAG
jgi:hypothetical protein